MLLIRTNFDCIILDSGDACEENLKDLFAAIQADDELLDKLDKAIVDELDCDGTSKNHLRSNCPILVRNRAKGYFHRR